MVACDTLLEEIQDKTSVWYVSPVYNHKSALMIVPWLAWQTQDLPTWLSQRNFKTVALKSSLSRVVIIRGWVKQRPDWIVPGTEMLWLSLWQ